MACLIVVLPPPLNSCYCPARLCASIQYMAEGRNSGYVRLASDGTLSLSIIILVLMLAAVICTIAASKWRMSKGLGCIMFILYGVFMTQALLRAFYVLPSCLFVECE